MIPTDLDNWRAEESDRYYGAVSDESDEEYLDAIDGESAV